MIVQLRVDDRLVHGQVTLMWGKELSTKGILVANDAAAQNETQSSTLKMACPSGQKLLIRTIDDAIKIANDPRAGEMRIFALTGNIADALKTSERGLPGEDRQRERCECRPLRSKRRCSQGAADNGCNAQSRRGGCSARAV